MIKCGHHMRRGLWGEFAVVTARDLANKILHLPICEPIGRSDINPRGGPGANPLRQHRIGQIRHAHPIFGLETMGLLTRIQILPKTLNLIAEPLAGTKDLTLTTSRLCTLCCVNFPCASEQASVLDHGATRPVQGPLTLHANMRCAGVHRRQAAPI